MSEDERKVSDYRNMVYSIHASTGISVHCVYDQKSGKAIGYKKDAMAYKANRENRRKI